MSEPEDWVNRLTQGPAAPEPAVDSGASPGAQAPTGGSTLVDEDLDADLDEEEDEDEDEPSRRRRLLFVLAIAFVGVILAGVAGAFFWYLNTGKPVSMLPVLNRTAPPHYMFSMYDLVQPLGVAVDDVNDRVYVTQSGGDQKVVIFDRAGNNIGKLEPPQGTGKLHVPVYVAVDPKSGDVYVTDRGTSTVYVYDSTGGYVRTVVPKGSKQWTPLGIGIDSAGRMLVTDVSGDEHTLLVMDPDGTVLQRLGAKEKFEFPNSVAGDANGDIGVADSNNGRVVIYDSRGALVGALTRGDADSPLGLPRGIAVDDSNRMYVVDASNHTIRVYGHQDPSETTPPKYQFSFGTEGSTDGTFEYPNGIAVDTKGRIYVTDRENGRLQVWSY
jgi:DNA-binding beta-propeller fold protein YncE